MTKTSTTSSQSEQISRAIWFPAARALEIVEKPIVAVREDQVRVRALFSGISHGTEMLVYRGEVPTSLALDMSLPSMEGSFGFPIKYGYASVGIVTETGASVQSVSKGDLVFAYNPHESDYAISSKFVVRLPSNLSPRVGIFFANIETAVNALLDATVRIGERVIVFGQGVVGLLITKLLRRAGVDRIITVDPFEKRRALSLAAGASLAIDPTAEDAVKMVNRHGGEGDLVFEVSGRPEVLNDAIRATAYEGRVIVVSWYGNKTAPLELGGDFHRKRITIRSSQVSNLNPQLGPGWTFDRRRELAKSYLKILDLDEMITQEFRFEDAAAAYELIDHRPQETVQVVLSYG
jgi:2-desacetyl-2-hydroxyethyl bacteriochlorophyllide A dehydrogenase